MEEVDKLSIVFKMIVRRVEDYLADALEEGRDESGGPGLRAALLAAAPLADGGEGVSDLGDLGEDGDELLVVP